MCTETWELRFPNRSSLHGPSYGITRGCERLEGIRVRQQTRVEQTNLQTCMFPLASIIERLGVYVSRHSVGDFIRQRSAKAGASEAPPAKKAGAIEVRPIAPPASTATATASGRGTDPPADWKGLIDKTALLAAAVGPGFEERTLREHDQNKYRFLLADHQYHPYYLEQRERAAKERAERESSRGSAAVPEEDDESAPPPLPAPAEPPTGYVSLDDEESVEIEESGEGESGGDDDSFYPDDRGGGGGQPLRLKSRSRSRSRSMPVEPVRAVVKPKATPPWRRPGGVFGPGESRPGPVPGQFPWSRNTKRVNVMRRSDE